MSPIYYIIKYKAKKKTLHEVNNVFELILKLTIFNTEAVYI